MNEANKGYERFDGCYGTVVSRCFKGAYLELDNGEQAFAYKFANLFPGTKVLCTVLKQATEGKKYWFPLIPFCNSFQSEYEARHTILDKQNVETLPVKIVNDT